MCEIDTDFDRCQVWDPKQRVARKEHRCDACGATIAAGEKYVHISSLFDGQWDKARSCLPCDEVAKRFGEEHRLVPHPTSLVEQIEECIQWDEESARKWRPTLRAIQRRRPQTGGGT